MASTSNLEHRPLGKGGLSVSAIGLGCMSLSGIYGAADDTVSEDLIRHAIDIGVDHFDSSDMYGWGHNEQVLGKALKGRRDGVVVATKFGQTQRPGQSNGVNGRPEYVLEACEASLKRLGIDVIDLYYQHRVDPTVPVEETVGAMAKLVAQGKVRFLGLSEAAPDRIRRAHAVHPIAAVQTEFSLLYRQEAEETGVGALASGDGRMPRTSWSWPRCRTNTTTIAAITSRRWRSRSGTGRNTKRDCAGVAA